MQIKKIFIVARGSTFECASILRMLKLESVVDAVYNNVEEIGKKFLGVINSLVRR